MRLSVKKRAYYEEHIEGWRHSGLSRIEYCKQANISYGAFKYWLSKLNSSDDVKTQFVEAKCSDMQDFGAILLVSLPNGVRIGVSAAKSNILIEQVLKFVGQLP